MFNLANQIRDWAFLEMDEDQGESEFLSYEKF